MQIRKMRNKSAVKVKNPGCVRVSVAGLAETVPGHVKTTVSGPDNHEHQAVIIDYRDEDQAAYAARFLRRRLTT